MQIVESLMRRVSARVTPKLRRLRYELFDRQRVDGENQLARAHVFDPTLTDREIVADFGYSRAIVRWMHDRGDETLRLDYPLGPKSVVIDVGGYSGAWCDAIVRRYDCHVHIVEPIATYASAIAQRFSDNPKVKVHAIALSDRDGAALMSEDGQGSSLLRSTAGAGNVTQRDVVAFLDENGLADVDLIKINIEGGEYALLSRMIDAGVIGRFANFQIQFHDAVRIAEGVGRARKRIRAALKRSHALVWQYPFVWEGWARRAAGAARS